MMDTRIMVLDILAGMEASQGSLAIIISETENSDLRSTLKQLRNKSEMSQEELYRIAKNKNYYIPAAKATEEEISRVRSMFT